MAELSYKIYKPVAKNELRFVRKGNCLAYVPETTMEEHVTIGLGDAQIMFDLKSFEELCSEVLEMPFKTKITKLKLVKG